MKKAIISLVLVALFAAISVAPASAYLSNEQAEVVQYVEGLNDSFAVHKNARYYTDPPHWYAIKYTPSVSYKIKRVELMAGIGTGNFIIQLRSDAAGSPSNTVLRSTSFFMADPVAWQGADFTSTYALSAGTPYWIVFRPVPGSRASVTWGIPPGSVIITHAFSQYSTGPWSFSTSLPWMAKFYEETTAKVDTILDFKFVPNPAKPGETVELRGTLIDANTHMPVHPAQVKVEYSTNGGLTWIYLWTLNTNPAGVFSRIFSAPGVGEYLVRVRYDGSPLYNPSSHRETLIVRTGVVWRYNFQLRGYADVLRFNVKGSVIYGVCDATGYHNQPVLGYIDSGKFYIWIDFTKHDDGSPIYYELAMIVGSVSTLSATMYRTTDGTSWAGPTPTGLIPESLSTQSEAAAGSPSTVEMEGWPPTYHFRINPFVDVMHVHVDGAVVHGIVDAISYHNQPVLGYVDSGKFYFAIDYTKQDDGSPIYYELSVSVVKLSTMSGSMYQTTDGQSYFGPTAIALVPP